MLHISLAYVYHSILTTGGGNLLLPSRDLPAARQIRFGQNDCRVVVVGHGRRLKRLRKQTSPSSRRMIPKEAAARGERRSPLLAQLDGNRNVREPRPNVARAGAVAEEDEIDSIGGDPLPSHLRDLVDTDHTVIDDTGATADGNPAFSSAGIDGQHRHLNATWTGPTV